MSQMRRLTSHLPRVQSLDLRPPAAPNPLDPDNWTWDWPKVSDKMVATYVKVKDGRATFRFLPLSRITDRYAGFIVTQEGIQ